MNGKSPYSHFLWIGASKWNKPTPSTASIISSLLISLPPAMPKSPRVFTVLDWLGLVLLWLFTIAVLAGFGSFGLHPELLAQAPSAADFYGIAFILFSRGHVIIAFLVLALLLIPRIRLSWLPALILAGLISLGMELMGTKTGFPFSGYEYTGLLGYRIAGLVPVLIPISWFMVAFPSYVLARRMTSSRYMHWILGALILTAWDLTLDPAMSDLTKYWIWENAGPYYGMPLVNLAGWFGTGILIMVAFHFSGTGKIADRIPPILMEAYYITVVVLSLGMTLLAGYWLATFLTLGVFAAIRVLIYLNSDTSEGLPGSP